MRVTWIIALMVFTVKSIAGDIIWHRGSVVLANKEVVVGEVARQSFDLLLFRNTQGVTVLPAHKVFSFRYHDESQNVNRSFVTAYGKYFERIVYGRLSVLRIQKMFRQEISEKHQEHYDFFIEEDKKIYTIASFRKKFFDNIKDELDLRLVSYRHLDPNTKHGAVSLIILYNKSFETRSV